MEKRIEIKSIEGNITGAEVFVGGQRISDKIKSYTIKHSTGTLPQVIVELANLPIEKAEYPKCNIKIDDKQISVIAKCISKHQLEEINRLWRIYNGG